MLTLKDVSAGYSQDRPSTLQFSNLSFVDWTGTSLRNTRTHPVGFLTLMDGDAQLTRTSSLI